MQANSGLDIEYLIIYCSYTYFFIATTMRDFQGGSRFLFFID